MQPLAELVCLLSPDEARTYKVLALRTNDAPGRKDLALFDALRADATQTDDELCARLYPEGNRNAYYRLKNRLAADVAKSLLLQHAESQPDLRIQKQLGMARLLRSRNANPLAARYARKAVAEAERHDDYEGMDAAYSLLIALAQQLPGTDPAPLIDARRQNHARLARLRRLDDVLARMSHRLHHSQNYGETPPEHLEELQAALTDIRADETVQSSPRIRQRIYQAVSQALVQQHNFAQLRTYVLHTFAEFESEGLFTKQNLELKLQMMVYAVNALYKTGAYRESLAWADALQKALEELGGRLRERYLFYYLNAQVINYSQIDKPRAIALLEGYLKGSPTGQAPPFSQTVVAGNLAVLYSDTGRPEKALQTLARLSTTEEFGAADEQLRLAMALAELAIRTTRPDRDLLTYRLEQVQKDFADRLSLPAHRRDAEFIDILRAWARQPEGPNAALRRRAADFAAQPLPPADAERELIPLGEAIAKAVR